MLYKVFRLVKISRFKIQTRHAMIALFPSSGSMILLPDWQSFLLSESFSHSTMTATGWKSSESLKSVKYGLEIGHCWGTTSHWWLNKGRRQQTFPFAQDMFTQERNFSSFLKSLWPLETCKIFGEHPVSESSSLLYVQYLIGSMYISKSI